MISSNARDSIDRIFRKAARARLARNEGDACLVTATGRDDASTGSTGERALILTISSIAFRLLLVLRFDDDARTHAYFMGDANGRSFDEVCMELGNLCCGAMNQELQCMFPDLGMSTPYMVSARCMSYLEVLKPGYLASYAVVLNDEVRVMATVCVCADAPLDFVADVSDAVETSGELELF